MINVRFLTADDYPSVCGLLKDCYTWLGEAEGLSPEQTEWLARHESSPAAMAAACRKRACLVAYVNGAAAGFVAISGNHIDLLYVDKGHQGQGIGHLLFKTAQRIIASAGFEELTLGAVSQAVEFYRDMGMRRSSEGHVEGLSGRPLFLMRKNLVGREDMAKISIDPALCARCGNCVSACNENVFFQPEAGKVPRVRNERFCISCGHCVAMCPEGAIRHQDYPADTIEPLRRDLDPTAEQVFEMLRARRSIRQFKTTRIEKEVVESILEGARLAPSAHNFRETEYLVLQDESLRERVVAHLGVFYEKLARHLRNPLVRFLFRLKVGKSQLAGIMRMVPDFEMVAKEAREGKDPFLHRAPCVIIAHAKKSVNFPEANAFLALHNATFVAQSLGLGGFLVGYVVGACQRDRALCDMIGIPDGNAVYGALALGYPKSPYRNWIQRSPVKVTWR
jgi:nitroreductase/NAD-dependent dihydropyrimidine dehydrogenase PreA subunit/GNAT superfamily N-acetyltransferase